MVDGVNRQWRLANRPKELVSRENFSWHEEKIPQIENNEFLVKNLILSFDPTPPSLDERKRYLCISHPDWRGDAWFQCWSRR